MQSVAFYSYSGGTGRSLLLSRLAGFLAQAGKRVVALDFDLESPGLHHKFSVPAVDRGSSGHASFSFRSPLLSSVAGSADMQREATPSKSKRGLVDYLLALLDGPEAPPPVADLVVPISLAAGARGQVDLLPAGAALRYRTGVR